MAGTGHWAKTVHVAGLAAHPDVTLVGVWGRDLAKAEEVARARGIASFARFEEMLTQVDAVSIALPPQVQAPLALQAAEAGKHLLLEKPLAILPAQAQAIAAAARRRDVAALVFFMRRFIPEVERAITDARGTRWQEAHVRIHSGVLINDSPYAQSIWRQAYAGALWDIGPHVLSVLIPLLGDVARIDARCGDDRVVTLTTDHDTGARGRVSLSLHAQAHDVGHAYTFRSGNQEITLPEPSFNRPEMLSLAAGDLLAAIANGQHTHRCDLRLGVRVVEILDAAARSIETGQSIQIPRSTVPLEVPS